MPVRKVVKRSGKNFRGYFPSKKMGCMIGWESLHERDAILVLEYSDDVRAFEAQPSEEIYYLPDGTQRRYYPDLRVYYRNGRVVDIEIKPSRKLDDPEVSEKLARVTKQYEASGRKFAIWTEKEFRSEPRFSNYKAQHRARPRLRKAA